MTLLYIKGESNVVTNDFIRLTMVHHYHNLADKTLEEDNFELLCLDLLFISGNTDCFYIYIEDVSFPLDPQIV